MDPIYASRLRYPNDPRAIQIGCNQSKTLTQMIGFIRLETMERKLVLLCIATVRIPSSVAA